MIIKYVKGNMRWLIICCCFSFHQSLAQFEVLDIPAEGVVEIACGNGICMVVDWETFIAKTYNLGDSFIAVSNPREYTSRTDIQFTQDSNFYVVAYRKDTLQQTVIFRTEDAGTSWQQLFHEPHYPSVFYMYNDSFGFVGTGLGALYRTKDGWQSTDIMQYSISTGMQRAYFLNDSVGLIGHSNGAMRTIDSGNNWNAGGFGSSSYYMRDFGQIDDSTIIATASTNSTNWIRIFRSTSSGATGKVILDIKNQGRRISEIKCFPNGECIAVGKNTAQGKALIYRTLDRGDSWYEIPVPTSKMLYTLEFANDSIAFIGGEDGVLIRMNRNKLPPPPDTTDTISAITEFQESTQFQLYPNPANDKITIQTNGSFSGNLGINLYDQVGRSLGMVFNGKSDSGKIEIDIQWLASGMYFLNISFGDRIEQLSFVKQ